MKCRICGSELDPNRAYCEKCRVEMMESEKPDAPVEKIADVTPDTKDSKPTAPAAESSACVSSCMSKPASAHAQPSPPPFSPVYIQQPYHSAAPGYAQPNFLPAYPPQAPSFYTPEPTYMQQPAPIQSAEPRLSYIPTQDQQRSFAPSGQQGSPYAPQGAPAYAQPPQQAFAPAYQPQAPSFYAPEPAYMQQAYAPPQTQQPQQTYQPAAPAYAQPQPSAPRYAQPQPSAPRYAQPQTPPFYTPEFGWIPQPAPAPIYAQQGQPSYPPTQPQQPQQAYQPAAPTYAQSGQQAYQPAAPTYAQQGQQAYQPAAPAYAQQRQQAYQPTQPTQPQQAYKPAAPTYTQPSQHAYQAAPSQTQKAGPAPLDTSEFSWNVYDFPKPKTPGDIPIKWPEYNYAGPSSGTFAAPDSRIQAAIDNKQPVVMVSQDASEGFVAVPDQRESAWKEPMDESTRRNEQFFTFQKKNEEFQRLLDREYEKLQSHKKGEIYREEAFNMPQEDLQAQRNAQVQAAMQGQQARNMQGFFPSAKYPQPYGQQQTPYDMQQFQAQQQQQLQQQYGAQQPPQAQYMRPDYAYRPESINEFERMLIDNTKDADLITGDTLPINLEKIQEEVRAQEAARLKQNEGTYRAQQNVQFQAEQDARSVELSAEMERLAIEKQPAKSMNEERLAAMAKAREEYFRTISGLAAYEPSPIAVKPQPDQGKDQVAPESEVPGQGKNQIVAVPEVSSQAKDQIVVVPGVWAAAKDQGAVISQVPVQGKDHADADAEVSFQGKDHVGAESEVPDQMRIADRSQAVVPEISDHVRIADRTQVARPEDKRTKASLDTTSLEKPIEELFAPLEEEIKTSGKESYKKKHNLLGRVFLVTLLIVALAELTLVGMQKLIPDNEITLQATEVEQVVITTVSDWGNSVKEFVTDTLEKFGLASDDQQPPEEETPLDGEPAFDLGPIVSAYNKNIQSITQSPTLVYDSAVTYEVEKLGDMTVVEDEDSKTAIYACLISFNSKWVDYVNGGEDDSCLDLLTADGAAYRSALNFPKVGQIREEFQSLMLGEIRKSDSAYYVFVRETISVTEAGKITTKSYSWIYELVDVAGEMKIVDYTPF